MNSKEEYIKLNDLRQYPIRACHWDEKHGNLHFICGIESVMEYAEYLDRYTLEQPVIVKAGWAYDFETGKPRCSNCGNIEEDWDDPGKFCRRCGCDNER